MPENENMNVWEALRTPPKHALKTIVGGRLAGKSDINPMWRYQAMTELFGPCGSGWKYEIVKTWLEEGDSHQRVAFAEVHLFYRDPDSDGMWSAPVPGIGGSMFIANEKNGLYTSDEAFKMAVTDALSVAMKMIGVAADVYLGMVDGHREASKYDAPAPIPAPKPEVQAHPSLPIRALPPSTPPERPKATLETFHTGLVSLASLMCLEMEDAFREFVSWAGTRIPGGVSKDWTQEEIETAVQVLREFYTHVKGGSYHA